MNSSQTNPITYKDSGVNIDTANSFIDDIKPLVKKTKRPEVLSSIGHYAGLFSIPKKYKQPILVSSTDGVGTKLKLALEWKKISGLGQDLVAMSVNDLLCMGAEPLFFLDYYATGKLNREQAVQVVGGIAKACHQIHCTLLGGETAEMPNLYHGDDFDLAGFVVGVVEKNKIIDGRSIKNGDSVIGIASSGFHSNGYSLVRKVVEKNNLNPDEFYSLKKPLREALLEPTKLYVNQVMELKKKFTLNGIAHITGGGLLENLPRIIPQGLAAHLHIKSWPRPTLFSLIQEWGPIAEEEMWRVFNCGIGLMLVVPQKEEQKILKKLKSMKEEAWVIGHILKQKKNEPKIQISKTESL